MAAMYLYSGSLWPSSVRHAAIDVQAGAIGYEAIGRTAAQLTLPTTFICPFPSGRIVQMPGRR